LEINPHLCGVRLNLGIIYYKQKQYEKAIDEYKKCLKTEPDYVLAHYNLGLAYYSKQQYKLAREQFEQVLKFDPTNQDAKKAKKIIEQIRQK
jgi:tetratricopeptide (TPR) repeat protein